MSIVDEEWRDVSGFEGYYQVSNLGRVRSVDRVIVYTNGKNKPIRSRILSLNNHRYSSVCLAAYGQKFTRTVHFLVAQAFIGDRPEGLHINHIDGNKFNNCAGNLEYCSPKDNARHAYATGLCDHIIGAHQHLSKLCESDIPVILSRLQLGDTYQKIADDYGVSLHPIYAIAKGVAWKHVDGVFATAKLSRVRHGSDHAFSKLNESDIPSIRCRLALGETQTAIAKDYGVNPLAISKIHTGKTWKHVK